MMNFALTVRCQQSCGAIQGGSWLTCGFYLPAGIDRVNMCIYEAIHIQSSVWMGFKVSLSFRFYCLSWQRLDIAKLNDLINKAEENMVQLRKRYENAVQERNDM